MKKSLFISILVLAGLGQYSGSRSYAKDEGIKTPLAPGIVYSNPRVYNVDYSFEMFPDLNKIDKAKDLKLWVPLPREWDSQKAVRIISVQPEPHRRYVDPDYGNPMLFWDFGKEPEQSSYKVDIKFRLESYDVSVQVDPNRVGPYDKTSKEYALYTRSTHTIHITPEIKELAREAVGDETNPYLQAERIVKFVGKKLRYKILDFEKGRGIDCLLAHPVVDEKTGREYYEGSCSQFSALMVALCRAVGIPARCVSGYVGWNPWGNPNDVKARYPFETNLSPAGLAATQFYGILTSHMRGEFFIPNFGWIPIDPMLGWFPRRSSERWIKHKGRDVRVGPFTPEDESEGYGSQWVALHDGRADTLCHAVLNIGKVRTSKVTILHHSDPFPADGLAGYLESLLALEGGEKDHRHWRQGVLNWPSRHIRNLTLENLKLDHSYKEYPRAKEDRDAFVCHMLRRQLGDEAFFKLVTTYVDLRQESGQAVPTSRFQELAEDISGQSLGWFFNQWVGTIELPWLKLDGVSARKDNEGWQVWGRFTQSGKTTFRLPIELAVDTKKGREKQTLWVEKEIADFDFHTQHEPRRLIVDPDHEVLKVQRMAPRLDWFWDLEPEFIIIYGTSGENQANKRTAKRFARDCLEHGRKIIKADTDVNESDLKTKCVFLIGRPETHRIAQQFKDCFPIKFDGAKFTWQGITYGKPTQGLGQVIENPNNAGGLIIMYAGLSPEAMQKMCDLEMYDSDGSYFIFDDDKLVAVGDWEDADGNLYWNFDTQPSVR